MSVVLMHFLPHETFEKMMFQSEFMSSCVKAAQRSYGRTVPESRERVTEGPGSSLSVHTDLQTNCADGNTGEIAASQEQPLWKTLLKAELQKPPDLDSPGAAME